MTKATYQNIRKLCSVVFVGNALYNSPRMAIRVGNDRVVICQLGCFSQEILVLSA